MEKRTGKIPRARYPARGAKELSRAAGQRLRWMNHYESHGRNAALTCRYFGISRQTFCRWRRRYDPQDLSRLEERSHRPPAPAAGNPYPPLSTVLQPWAVM